MGLLELMVNLDQLEGLELLVVMGYLDLRADLDLLVTQAPQALPEAKDQLAHLDQQANLDHKVQVDLKDQLDPRV